MTVWRSSRGHLQPIISSLHVHRHTYSKQDDTCWAAHLGEGCMVTGELHECPVCICGSQYWGKPSPWALCTSPVGDLSPSELNKVPVGYKALELQVGMKFVYVRVVTEVSTYCGYKENVNEPHSLILSLQPSYHCSDKGKNLQNSLPSHVTYTTRLDCRSNMI